MPYAFTCAAVSAVTYIIAGFVKNPVVSLICGFAILFILLYIVRRVVGPLQTAEKTAAEG